MHTRSSKSPYSRPHMRRRQGKPSKGYEHAPIASPNSAPKDSSMCSRPLPFARFGFALSPPITLSDRTVKDSGPPFDCQKATKQSGSTPGGKSGLFAKSSTEEVIHRLE